ncbi:hypothetical protein AMTRI_Chr13g92200 [Amborella trichopoda]|uniref:Uncharacterized protein n=1 Tax=Amborella trichopoda TaxID=13333 RepID=U5D865_AMBTC|nr:cold-regulated 413 plasma membrane protein 1 isoform X1 [Amborella trichopoda]ERN17602.1 hypothetical protein AMTR_s00059p00160430 [Amborella trichopoda]|eukprot:XP_006856135.1 cold-regulated 413 plasma membrane protein 1 isoform X1 [Amborella trichopoda]
MDMHGLMLGHTEKGDTFYHWGASVAAVILLLLNYLGHKSHLQTSLLVVYIFSCLPLVLFNILRGEFGMWASFLAVLAHFFCSPYFRASRFPVFVVAPSLVAHLLRGSIGWVVFCLTMGTWVGLDFIHRSGGFTHCLQKNQSIFYIIICIPLVLFPGIAGIRLA